MKTEFKKGDRVTADVVWKDGRTTRSEGTFQFALKDKAYIELSIGGVAEVDLDTVEEA